MEAASARASARRRSLFAVFRDRRQERRVKRLLSDAERFERAAKRLEQQLEPTSWQVRQLRNSAVQLRELAIAEAA
jgi:hypothetical protein